MKPPPSPPESPAPGEDLEPDQARAVGGGEAIVVAPAGGGGLDALYESMVDGTSQLIEKIAKAL